jgi:hypothetical protein
MSYTLGKAAKATGKSKTTIQRAVSKGLISAQKDKSGRYSIDPSELHRVFPMVSDDTVSETPKVDVSRPPDDALLMARIEALEDSLEREKAVVSDLRVDRDAWKQQATALLAAPIRKEPERKRRSWRSLFGLG